eukprot:8783423-Heterocapsa_arctica.AAC.1
MVLAAPTPEPPPAGLPAWAEPPSAASHDAAAQIPVVDLTLDDAMGEWTAPETGAIWDLTETEEATL